MNQAEKFKSAATALWLTASFIAGIAIAGYFNSSARQALFLVLLTVGTTFIIRLNIPRPNIPRPIKKDLSQPEINQNNTKFPTNHTHNIKNIDKSLDHEQSRQWLDDFMVRQQGDDNSKPIN